MRLLLLLGWLLASWPAGERQVKAADIRFQIVNAGFTVNGTLAGLEATVQFDPAHPEQAHMRATVPVGTIQTGIGLRDKHLQKPDYFDAEKFPTITLESRSFRQLGPARYEGLFALTMKGVTHEVALPFTASAARELRGTLRVNRLDYGIGKESLVLANEVLISLVVPLAA